MGVGQQKIVGTLTIAAEQDSSLMALSWLFCAGGGASVNSAEITGGKALLWYYYRITRLSQLILPRTIYPQREGKKERRRSKTTELNHSCVDNIQGSPVYVSRRSNSKGLDWTVGSWCWRWKTWQRKRTAFSSQPFYRQFEQQGPESGRPVKSLQKEGSWTWKEKEKRI